MSIKIAVMVHNLRLEFMEALKFTADNGCTGVHMVVSPDKSPESLDAAGRKQLLKTVKDMGLEFSAVCRWGGGVDLGEPKDLQKNIEEGKRTLEFAADLECGIWQGHCGIMPTDKNDPKWARFVDSFGQICQHGEKVGARLAIETGPEPPEVLLEMIKDVGSPALCVNYDPANLIIWPAHYAAKAGKDYDKEKALAEFKPMEGVKVLGKNIIHTHAKDALVNGNTPKEVPLGDGWIDWKKYVADLRSVGFDGYFAIEREVGENPRADIKRAIDYLKTL